ncbi:transposon protein, putative, CACTA, En/Spm sub-class [Panicum miliaceum]|uniref:Transposon protein, putative, CACTA, En/Spm sub-class n=1 Tax=Panicum miliaceum TaxID=4540 RepID=A0A3L6PZ49_PANMI|nr:transposon protein, putative, CACTA, En/Spm sub-class [Panicum miliaceum]
MEDRSWMHLKNRTCEEYLNGLKSFIRAAEVDMLNQRKSAMCCRCVDCQNDRRFTSSMHVHAHLIIRGFMDDYKYWNMHGEEGINYRDLQTGCMDQRLSGSRTAGQVYEEGLFASHPGQDGEEALFGGHDNSHDPSDEDLVDISGKYVHMADNLEEMVRDAMGYDEYTYAEFEKLKRLVTDMKTPLYPSCNEKYTKFFSSLKLLQLKATHHWTDKSFKSLLDLLKDMLSKGNEIPKTTYEAKHNICPLGLEVEKIHAYKNDCILFRCDNADLTKYPKCGTPRCKRRNDGGDETRRSGAPQKVAWYFPLIPRLRRLFATSNDACLLRWHKEGRTNDDYVRHPTDSTQWRVIDFRYGVFSNDPRNLRFARSTDGMNPFGHMSSSHSVWPVLLSIYNLPPWLCNKRKYMIMSVLISGPHQPSNDIDVHLRPLVDDLKTLWSSGVELYDAYKKEPFTLHGLLFCTIIDIPGGCSVSGQCKGDKDCLQCLDDTETLWLNNSKKKGT